MWEIQVVLWCASLTLRAMICELQIFLLFVQYNSLYRIVHKIHARVQCMAEACACSRSRMHWRAERWLCLFVQVVTLQIMRFNFRGCSGTAIVFVFWLPGFSTREHKTHLRTSSKITRQDSKTKAVEKDMKRKSVRQPFEIVERQKTTEKIDAISDMVSHAWARVDWKISG